MVIAEDRAGFFFAFLILGGALYLKWHFRIVDMLKQEKIFFDGRNQVCAEDDVLNLFDVPEGATSFLYKCGKWQVDQLVKVLAVQGRAALHFVALDISEERLELPNLDFVIN